MGFLLEYDGQAAGFFHVSLRWASEVGGIECWLEDLFVLKDFQNKGIGSSVLRFLKKEIPAKRYRLEVEEENCGAIALYQKNGFSFLPYKQMICDGKD